MRGEKRLLTVSPMTARGSPPHARGKVRPGLAQKVPPGITPACAGKSNEQLVNVIPEEDHPRMRGEKSGHGSSESISQGSPPHARGKARLARLQKRS